MKLPPSKSILSPGRPRDPSSQISLSTSLSRRLRTNGSLKGGQASPMFPPTSTHGTSGKKKGCAFENPEPSSPKVTCIGQVRVKSKKKGKRVKKSGVRRRGGEVSFRNVEEREDEQGQYCNNRNNGKWVHLPLTICEGLRSFSSEINCFSPCRGWNSSCMAKEEEEEEKVGGGFCGAVFARWVVDDEQGKGREIELLVGDGEEKELERRSYRRHHVFEEIEFKEEKIGEGEEDGGGRLSICIPPKNALLLMRCRSDPVKLAALASKFLEAPPPPPEEEEEDEEKCNVGDESVIGEAVCCEKLASFKVNEEEEDKKAIILVSLEGEEENQDDLEEHVQETSAKRISDVLQQVEEEEEIVLDPELMEIKLGVLSENEDIEEEEEEEEEEEGMTREGSDPKEEDPTYEPLLPDCLLLMMCEPKLSMEVSKETWVCSTDFIRWMPGARSKQQPAVKKKEGGDELEEKKRTDLICQPLVVKCKDNNNVDENEKLLQIQPPRSSCYYPAQPPVKGRGESMASVIGKKLGGVKGYEPFVLTRCKSEPMRSAAKLVPQEGCFWKNRKLEPAATLGFGAAGVGF